MDNDDEIRRRFRLLVGRSSFARVIEVRDYAIDLEFIANEFQPFPFVVGPETVDKIQNLSGQDILRAIGYTEEYIKKKFESGVIFYLLIFSDELPNQQHPIRASWDGLLELFLLHSPLIHSKLSPLWEVIKATPVDTYIASGVFDPQNPLKEHVRSMVAFEEWLLLQDNEDTTTTSNTLVTANVCRAFLRWTMKCMELYRGDGYAYDDAGRRGVDEYLIPRMSINSLKLLEQPRLLT